MSEDCTRKDGTMSIRKRYIKKILLSALVVAIVLVVATGLTAAMVVIGNVHDETMMQILATVVAFVCIFPMDYALLWLWDRD